MHVYNWALLHRNTFMPVLFVIVSTHAGTSKYLDKSIAASFTCFLQTITVYRYIRVYYPMPNIHNRPVIVCRKQVDDAPVHDILFLCFHKKYRHILIVLQKVPAKYITMQKRLAMCMCIL